MTGSFGIEKLSQDFTPTDGEIASPAADPPEKIFSKRIRVRVPRAQCASAILAKREFHDLRSCTIQGLGGLLNQAIQLVVQANAQCHGASPPVIPSV
jgi:hypothetical protein